MTVTNVSAPVDSWRFGSLAWVSKDYKVRSPIAVKGALFDAPAEVGTGTSGSVSFPVKFGYTGAYTAAAHGLVQATLTHANVKQDPNQEFAPGDVTTGGANLHSRWCRVLPDRDTTRGDRANADLDIYVVGPNGEEFDSTAGGTDEMIDISARPMARGRSMCHGWSTPGGDSDYDMWSWAIPSSPGGGSLSIVSAPTSGQRHDRHGGSRLERDHRGRHRRLCYLGAVSHTEASGVMGLTLVNVDNRP